MYGDATSGKPSVFRYGTLAALIMAYGWGYRGTVGHEGGAMVPGALLGMAICLGSGRLDWHRRSVVAGLFGAIGWAWGGSFSYMEQTFYALSDSFPDVLYGYTMLFLLGGLWAGIGGGVLGLALTEPRSELERLIRPFVAICAVFLTVYLYLFFAPGHKEAIETLTVRYFNNTDWFSASIIILVSGIYWILVPKDRSAAALYFLGATAWWLGYLGLTKLGGLRLAPLHRSESWSGIIAVLVVLMGYLAKRHNRAALLLCRYGILGGGIAFSLAVFIRHPLVVQWGPFRGVVWPQWRVAEESFGLFMGLAIALGVHRLNRDVLEPPREDSPRYRLDVFAVFTILVALLWVNFRRHAAPALAASSTSAAAPFLGIPAWAWFVFGGGLATLPVLFFLRLYLKGDRTLVPPSAFGKGLLVVQLLLWLTVAGYVFHDPPSASGILGHLILWIPAAAASFLLLSCASSTQHVGIPATPTISPSDHMWRPDKRYWVIWPFVPVLLLCITCLSLAMQEGPLEGMGRKRFGPDAYWRQTARLIGSWQAVGTAGAVGAEPETESSLLVTHFVFNQSRGVTALLPSGKSVDTHQWFLKNQYIWLRWNDNSLNQPRKLELPLEFQNDYLYIALPGASTGNDFTVFRKESEQ